MNLDFTRYRTWLKTEMLKHPALENPEERPYESSWLAYAFECEATEDNPPLERLLNRLEQWAVHWDGKTLKDIGPLALTAALLPYKRGEALVAQIRDAIVRLLQQRDSRWSLLNEPAIVFAVALFIKKYARDLSAELRPILKEKCHGQLWRRILIEASLVELKQMEASPHPEEGVDERDIILQLWFTERYLPDEPKLPYWQKFSTVKPGLVIEADSELRTLDVLEAAFLYEALERQLEERDPLILFDNYSFEPEIRNAVKNLFVSGEYPRAVEEAALTLKDIIRKVSHVDLDDEGALLSKAFMPPEKPRIRFNEYLHTRSGKNEQSGLYLIAKGIFTAFRNPPTHEPSDHPVLQGNAFDAYDKLVIINYLLRRVKRSNTD